MDANFFQTERYAKNKSNIIADLDSAMVSLKSMEVAARLKGAKRLSYHSRRPLGWSCLPVREWFWDDSIRVELSEICRDESDEKVLSYLLSALRFLYDRYLTHPLWEELYSKKEELAYVRWVLPIAEECNQASVLIKMEVAGIFATCSDNRAWDIYNEILPKKSAYRVQTELDFMRYAKNSITYKQRIDLLQTIEKFIMKLKNPEAGYYAKQIKKILESIS